MEAKKNARKIAVQAVFQLFFSNDDIEKIIQEFYKYRINEYKNNKNRFDFDFLNEIVTGVFKNKREITLHIEEHLSKEWLLQRVDHTMQAIISLAIYELTYCSHTPYKVIINEYVSIASLYFDDANIGFVNGILDTIAKKIRNSKNE